MSILDNLFAKEPASNLPPVNPLQTPPTDQPNSVAVPLGTAQSSAVDPIAAQDKSVLSSLDQRSTQVLTNALNETKRVQQPLIEPEQFLVGLLQDKEIFKLLQDFSVNVASLDRQLQASAQVGTFTGSPTLSDNSKQILEDAFSSCKQRGVDFITPEDILMSIFAKSTNISAQLQAQGLQKDKIEQKLSKSSEFKTGKKSVLKEFGVDLTEKAAQGKLDPVTGRDTEITRVIHILLRRTKNNPIIIGEAGVGKTAIVEGLAQLIAQKKIASDLASKKIIQLDVSSLVAGTSHRGEFEERLEQIIKEVMMSGGQIILFIDEIHTLMGAGDTDGALDASNILKPYLSRGQLQVIGTTTIAEYRKYFEKDRAFERRFQPVMADEPNEENAIAMVKILQPKYEAFHKVTFSDDAIKTSVYLSKRYIGDRYLPDKAIDLLDEAASEVRLDAAQGIRPNIVNQSDIEKVVSRWSGIPITKLTEKEGEKLLHLEDLIHKKYINQQNAVKAVAEAVRRGRIGLANINRPIASFIFLGPTGTGKTELAKILAEIMFGKSDAMIRLDMSEYMEKHEVAKLVGAPPGYVGYEEGGQLTEAVRTKPYSIVLLDEIEKAHPDVFNILLQLLEDGRLTDNKGNTISFKNTIIIATSNIGSDLIRDKLSADITQDQNTAAVESNTPAILDPSQSVNNFIQPAVTTAQNILPTNPQQIALLKDQRMKELTKIINQELNKFFKPEVLNRFDEIVIFEPLTRENMVSVAKLQLNSATELLHKQEVDIQISQSALNQLASEGYDPIYGARPLRRLIQRVIENPIAIYLIDKSVKSHDVIIIDYDATKGEFTFTKSPNQSYTSPVNIPGQNPEAETNLSNTQSSQGSAGPILSSPPQSPAVTPAPSLPSSGAMALSENSIENG